MKQIIHVRIFRGDSYYVAECLDLPVVTQAKTLDELTTYPANPSLFFCCRILEKFFEAATDAHEAADK